MRLTIAALLILVVAAGALVYFERAVTPDVHTVEQVVPDVSPRPRS